ncbi:MAG: PAS domain S-box protein [Candidatus Eisenbacteria bacterium]
MDDHRFSKQPLPVDSTDPAGQAGTATSGAETPAHPLVPPERWRQIFDALGVGLALGSPDGKTLDAVNEAFAAMHGSTVEELEGSPILDVFAPHARLNAVASIRLSRETGEIEFDSIHRRRDASTFPVRVISRILRDQKGRPVQRVTCVLDMSEERERERALRATSVPQTVLEHLFDGCQLIDFGCRYLYLNEEAERHAGRSRETLLGKTMMECFPGIEETAMFQTLREVLRDRTQREMLNEFVYPDGSRRTFHLQMVPVPQGVCVLSWDRGSHGAEEGGDGSA